MPDRVFRLLERLQYLDDLLRRASARRNPDPVEIVTLQRLKVLIRGRLSRMARMPATAA